MDEGLVIPKTRTTICEPGLRLYQNQFYGTGFKTLQH